MIAGISKAMAHPARVALLEYLLGVDLCICGDIVNELPLSQPTVSQHLKELKSAGLIKGNITVCDNAAERCPIFPGSSKGLPAKFTLSLS